MCTVQPPDAFDSVL